MFLNFISNKPVKFDDRDALWMKNFVKSKAKLKNKLYKNRLFILSFKK